jgi:catechol 2,3-dioxygenase-like lactoylglutathione lyase family enzyme
MAQRTEVRSALTASVSRGQPPAGEPSGRMSSAPRPRMPAARAVLTSRLRTVIGSPAGTEAALLPRRRLRSGEQRQPGPEQIERGQSTGVRARLTPGRPGHVEDADAVHAFLRDRGIDVSDIQDFPWGRFCFFSDPDGNGWSVHEPPRPR